MGVCCSDLKRENSKNDPNYVEIYSAGLAKNQMSPLPRDDRFDCINDDLDSTMLKSPEQQYETQHTPKPSIAVLLHNPPDFNNHNKKIHLKTLEPFQYDVNKPENKHLPSLPAYKIVDSNVIYVGQWKNGLRHGRGEQYWPDGSVYQGYWKNDKRNGKGRYISEEGNIYEGEYELDMKQGRGKQTWNDGSVYIGQFSGGKRHGQGVLEWADGRKYTGDWQTNKMHGTGEFVWPDGRSFKGEYKEDMKHGQGVFEWSNGVKYQGPFANNKQHGEGMLLLPNGGHKKGIWQEGKLIKSF